MITIGPKFNFLLSISLILISKVCLAQQQHFIYIQSDNKQPFYIKMDSKILSSTTSGYAIIPKLAKSDMMMQIGFPKNEFPPQIINIKVTEDAGYSLKNFGEGKWGLFNLQTMQIVYANDKKNENVAVVNKPKAVDEMKTQTKLEEKTELKEASVANSIAIADDNPIPSVEKTDTQFIKVTDKLNVVETISRAKAENTATEYLAIYKIKGENTTDFIDVIIEKDRESENLVIKQEVVSTKNTEKSKVEPSTNSSKSEEKFLDMELPNPNSVTGTTVTPVKPEPPAQIYAQDKETKKLSVNSDCVVIATEDDFFETRKAMAAKRTDELMITIAIKNLKKKCFSTAQIKGLGAILLQDSSRLSFFEQAYSFVTDPQNYESLSSELNSTELKNKFKTIINK